MSCKWSDRVKETPELIELGTFRSCKCTSAAFGGVTLWALTPEENGKSLVVGWQVHYTHYSPPERTGVLIPTDYRGQNAVNGELGMGEDKPKSATKPVQVETLLDLDIFQCVLLPAMFEATR